MKEYITTSSILFTIGSIIVFMLSLEKKQFIIGSIINLIISLLISLIICTTSSAPQVDEWNNGVCIKCHSADYVFVNAVGQSRAYLTYFYQCPNCGYTIKENTLKNK